ncbi:MAG: type II toxin-antitoxin system RelB family antitoxin [Puniceicoccales bacterium]
MVAIHLEADIEERLERAAQKTGRTAEFFAREAILEHLEDLEDYYLAAEAARSPGKLYSSDDVKRELGL